MDIDPWISPIQSYIKGASDPTKISHTLQTLAHLLISNHDSSCSVTELCPLFASARVYFLSGPYEELLYQLLTVLVNVEVVKTHGKIISSLFLEGPAHVSFEVLCSGLSSRYTSLTNERCMSYLSQLVIAGKLTDIMTSQCSTETHLLNIEHDSLVQVIVSLPDLAANRFESNVPDSLTRSSYYPSLYQSILQSMESVRIRLRDGLDSSLSFISQLIGKLCLHGFAMDLWKVLLANIIVNHDFLLSRVFHKMVTGIPVRALDSTIIPLLRCVHHYEDLSALLGNTILDSKKLQYLIMEKVLLHKFYRSADVCKLLYNVIGYLACSATRLHLYQTTFSRLLQVWADSSSIRCVSFDQHLYMSKAIVVCSTFLPDNCSETFRLDLFKQLMTGLQHHLSSSDSSIRHTGMAVAEIVSNKLNLNLEQRLQFEYESDEILVELKSMMSCPTQPGQYMYTVETEQEVIVDTTAPSTSTADGVNDDEMAVELDSDDDLEPMGEFEDKGRQADRPPMYLGDCMQGLLSSERPDKVEASLKVASQLIRRDKVMTEEVSVEFAKILLHMDSSLAIDNYLIYRHESLVSLLVISPAPVAEYLCKQFCTRNYNVRQRLDMLDALAAAASQLADPNAVHEQRTSSLVEEMKAMNVQKTVDEQGWREIVDRRIESKTRRFASASHPTEQGTANRFSSVAGHFFFPLLMAVSGGEDEYNPLTVDTILLVQYLYTLGKIAASAQHCPLASRIASELLQVVWSFRCSRETAVRKAAVFCIAMSIMVMPTNEMLKSRLLAETGEYLSSLVENDTNSEVKDMAVKVFSHMQHQLSQGLSDNR